LTEDFTSILKITCWKLDIDSHFSGGWDERDKRQSAGTDEGLLPGLPGL
jgi:hypothetical protein